MPTSTPSLSPLAASPHSTYVDRRLGGGKVSSLYRRGGSGAPRAFADLLASRQEAPILGNTGVIDAVPEWFADRRHARHRGILLQDASLAEVASLVSRKDSPASACATDRLLTIGSVCGRCLSSGSPKRKRGECGSQPALLHQRQMRSQETQLLESQSPVSSMSAAGSRPGPSTV